MQGPRYKWDMIHRKFTPMEPSAVTHGLATIFSTQLQPGVAIEKHIADLQAAKNEINRAAQGVFPKTHGEKGYPMISEELTRDRDFSGCSGRGFGSLNN